MTISAEQKRWISDILEAKKKLGWSNARFNAFCRSKDANSYLKFNDVIVLSKLSEQINAEVFEVSEKGLS